MVDKKLDLNSLSQAIDTTWGRSSTPKTASYSVKMLMQGDERLLVTYQVIVNFGTEREMILTKRSCSEEADSVIAETIKHVKGIYKDLSGDTLKVKEDMSSDSIEIIGFGIHNLKRTALYRKKVIFEIA